MFSRFVFVRYASQLLKEGVSLLRWLLTIVICLFVVKRLLQLEHWARSSQYTYSKTRTSNPFSCAADFFKGTTRKVTNYDQVETSYQAVS